MTLREHVRAFLLTGLAVLALMAVETCIQRGF